MGTSKKNISVIQSAIEQVLPEFTFGGPLPEGEGAAEKISVGVIYVRDSADVKGAKELIRSSIISMSGASLSSSQIFQLFI